MNILNILILFSLLISQGIVVASPFDNSQSEKQLIEIIDNINNADFDTALINSKQLIADYPKFRLAKLIYADILSSRTGNTLSLKNEYLPLYHEAKVRFNGQKTALNIKDKIPKTLVSVPNSIKYILYFDLSESRIYLIKNDKNKLSLVDDHYISQGKEGFGKQFEGDNKTPIGVYSITSFLDDEQLPELYGWGAFPINYPNTLDKLAGKTGHGIWLHGIPRTTYSRPPKDSEGCVVLNNESLKQLQKYIVLQKTPIILSSSIEWQSTIANAIQKQKFNTLFKNWVDAWEGADTSNYLSYYSAQFKTKNKNFRQWADHKTKVFNQSSNIQVTISDRTMFLDPNDKNILHVRFYQNYKSDQFKGNAFWKEQFWKKEQDGNWRITYEG